LPIATKMKKEKPKGIRSEVVIPEGITASFQDGVMTVKGKKGEVKKLLSHPLATLSIADGKVIISSDKTGRKNKAIAGTYKALIKNMFRGVTDGYEYKMKAVAAHFPMNIALQNNMVVIKNFLGEKKPRTCSVPKGVEVKIDANDITVTGIERDVVGQTAALIEQTCRITNRDRRIFQDGIFITQKPGRETR